MPNGASARTPRSTVFAMKLNDTVGRTDRRFGCGVLRDIRGLAGGWPFSESHAVLESITASFVSPLTEPALREQVGVAATSAHCWICHTNSGRFRWAARPLAPQPWPRPGVIGDTSVPSDCACSHTARLSPRGFAGDIGLTVLCSGAVDQPSRACGLHVAPESASSAPGPPRVRDLSQGNAAHIYHFRGKPRTAASDDHDEVTHS